MVNFSVKEDPFTNKDTTNLLGSLGLLLNKFKGDEQAEIVINETFSKVERAKREWESTVDALPELICIIDENGRIVRTNRTIEKWGFGDVKTVIDRSYHSLVHPHCQQPCYLSNAIHQAVNSAGAEYVIEEETYDKTLNRFISARIQPVSMKDNTPEGHRNLVVILKDISVRKRAEQALYRQNGRLVALNAINKAILAADSPEEIAQATLKRIQPLVPYQQAHLLIKTPETDQLLVLASIANNNTETDLENGQKIPETAVTQCEERPLGKFFVVQSLKSLDNRAVIEEQWAEQDLDSYMNVPLKAGEYNIGVLQLAANNPAVFEPEQIEIIREIAETLTIAIQQSQLHQKLGRTNDELQRILRTKHEIMQDVSHDLRSPLALIKGYAELLKEGFLGTLNDEQANALNVIDKKGEQLLTLVNRLFKLQTVGKDTLDKTEFNLNQHLHETIQSWQILTTNKNIRLQLQIPDKLPIITADASLLDQVFTNLLDNALKFSPVGSKIMVNAWSEGTELIVSITDQGLGIEPEKAAQIFERFYQVKSSGQAKAGAGIGLALCKAIVDAHDGRIWAKSAGKDQGTTFFIALPLDKIEQLEA
ncbi:MAG: GAF domain-containing protein [Ardenticatenaceae bacterium]|nr:GAF domain-containing protein [Ardenticatenaceae bacterium]MCB9444768.1 GAF domain-containing protein [Ardenticatenaceae bacterium]